MRPRAWFVLALALLGCGADDGAMSGPESDAAVDAVAAEAGSEAGLEDVAGLDAGPEVASEAALADSSDGGGEELDALSPYVCPIELAVTLQTATVHELRDKLLAGEDLSVLDVREPHETASGIIEGALRMPWTSGVLQSEHATLPSGHPTYVICRSGARSLPAATYLVDQGHTCVFNVQGGMNAWEGAGYPTVVP
jgi:rhodanese-related sulfurtransferase